MNIDVISSDQVQRK